jgi:hypothetical protein
MPMKSCMRDAPGTVSKNLIVNRSCDKLLSHTLAGEPPAVCDGVQGESQHTAAANTCMCRIHIAQKCIVFPIARGLLACRLRSIRSAVTGAICETKMVVLVPPAHAARTRRHQRGGERSRRVRRRERRCGGRQGGGVCGADKPQRRWPHTAVLRSVFITLVCFIGCQLVGCASATAQAVLQGQRRRACACGHGRAPVGWPERRSAVQVVPPAAGASHTTGELAAPHGCASVPPSGAASAAGSPPRPEGGGTAGAATEGAGSGAAAGRGPAAWSNGGKTA